VGTSQATDSDSTANFADHFTRNLQLPPVAEACIRTLLVHCKHEQRALGVNSGIKLSSLCAAITYFVCTVGAAMQKAAKQAHAETNAASRTKQSGQTIESSVEKGNLVERSQNSTESTEDDEDDDEVSKSDDSESESEPFDVFSHAAIVEDQPEKLEYDMRRMWDAWAEQMTWSRTLLEIERSCNVSSNIVLNLYKSDMYPRRETLLGVLKAAVTTEQVSSSECAGSVSSLRQTPLASILLAHVSTAGAIMSSK